MPSTPRVVPHNFFGSPPSTNQQQFYHLSQPPTDCRTTTVDSHCLPCHSTLAPVPIVVLSPSTVRQRQELRTRQWRRPSIYPQFKFLSSPHLFLELPRRQRLPPPTWHRPGPRSPCRPRPQFEHCAAWFSEQHAPSPSSPKTVVDESMPPARRFATATASGQPGDTTRAAVRLRLPWKKTARRLSRLQ